jgi:transcriptional regulator with XRE-family HTH domain
MVGMRLQSLRKKKELSRKAVADYLGVHETTYGKYELGHREPDFRTIQRLADFYTSSLDYLLGRTDDPNIHDNNYGKPQLPISFREQQIIAAYRENPAMQAAVDRILGLDDMEAAEEIAPTAEKKELA